MGRLARRIAAMSVLLATSAAAVLVSAMTPALAQATIATSAPHAFLLDADSGTVLLNVNGDELMPPASMAKIMTVEVVANALKEGKLSLSDEFVVTENAWRKGGATSGGSTMFADLNSMISIDNLLHGIMIQSGNDACIVVAEGMAGTEEVFAQMMTNRARELGLKKSVFRNSTGLPDPDQKVTARELAMLARHLIQTYPDIYSFYSQTEFEWNGITQKNRNPLLALNIGADGVKTGYTAESGYGLVGSAVQDGRRLIVVVNGLPTSRERATEAQKLLLWGFRAFEELSLFGPGERVGEVPVYGGLQSTVALRSDDTIKMLIGKGVKRNMKARIVYQGPLMAPVAQGDRVGALRIYNNDEIISEAPLFAAESVDVGPLHKRALDAIWELSLGWLQ
ncbi:MAG: D-alanyl-D-alanine carboxypeptidase [Rhodobiaceae bacterium]|nr:D-alanyl-D-alanine carboxypeptidase [Rhodobiaceae bacterium]MCC0057349.1 D-alanyl-D-alanine carboxypeptidase [Rhodobiaceae bacterium]